MNWPLAEAKNKLSDVIERALKEGPQTITRRGAETVVVLSAQEYRRLMGSQRSFKNYLLEGPSFEAIALERDTSLGRNFDLCV